ncbi:beta-1,3-galactosyltransferase 2-like [Dendropsophus ebraccatus]|uniref:beta-1,3-galactosyltransferase 2-like n=1 Tax=Dendropsophus ebraccatus TaxID=150705 RepID=UPI003831AB9E
MILRRTFFKVFFLVLLYIISLCGLFVAYRFHQNGHLSYENIWGNKTSPTRNHVTHEMPFPLFPPSSSFLEYINISSYPYIINEPNKCKVESPFLIFLVETVAIEVDNRMAIRRTYGNPTFSKRASIMCLFLLGKNSNENSNVILKESNTYHDIIQKDFQDTYRNLTIKTMMGIEWVSNHCPTAKYVMKTDSDMFVNTDRLLDLLGPDQPQKQNYFTGFVMKYGRPHRNMDSKWYMPHSIYPGKYYPTFCSGTGYVFSGDVAPKILRSSFYVKYVYLEDVFVGICLDREGVKVQRPPDNELFSNNRVEFDPCVYNRIITSHYMNPADLINYWFILQDQKEQCSKSSLN